MGGAIKLFEHAIFLLDGQRKEWRVRTISKCDEPRPTLVFVLSSVHCVLLTVAHFRKPISQIMSIAGAHDAPGKTATVGAYGLHENVQHGDFVTEMEERDLKRGLGQRHIQMIALAGNFSCRIY
jgi:hypothetical protein